MRFHTIHVPSIEIGNLAECVNRLNNPIDKMVPVKEGFCWPAFFFSLFWAFWHRLWIVGCGLAAVNILVHLLMVRLGSGQFITLAISFGIAVLFGYYANDFRRTKLKQDGYSERCVVLAPNGNKAILRYVNISNRGR